MKPAKAVTPRSTDIDDIDLSFQPAATCGDDAGGWPRRSARAIADSTDAVSATTDRTRIAARI
jgi:hypothetical protein